MPDLPDNEIARFGQQLTMVIIATFGLILPIVLIPIITFTGYSETIEEIAKAVVILLFVTKLPSLRSRILAALLLGGAFGISESILYLVNVWQLGDSAPFWMRVSSTVPMHMLTASILMLSVHRTRYAIPIGLALALAVHLGFNSLV